MNVCIAANAGTTESTYTPVNLTGDVVLFSVTKSFIPWRIAVFVPALIDKSIKGLNK